MKLFRFRIRPESHIGVSDWCLLSMTKRTAPAPLAEPKLVSTFLPSRLYYMLKAPE